VVDEPDGLVIVAFARDGGAEGLLVPIIGGHPGEGEIHENADTVSLIEVHDVFVSGVGTPNEIEISVGHILKVLLVVDAVAVVGAEQKFVVRDAGVLIFLSGLVTGWIPVLGKLVGWVLGIVGALVDVYVVAGIVIQILVFAKIIKD
jgi:hypothetical protein